MNLGRMEDSVSRFETYIAKLTTVVGHADRVRPMNDYCAGLLASEGRRSVEPIAAVTAPEETAAQHQRLLHFCFECTLVG
jgi:SRSO17 transposase